MLDHIKIDLKKVHAGVKPKFLVKNSCVADSLHNQIVHSVFLLSFIQTSKDIYKYQMVTGIWSQIMGKIYKDFVIKNLH